MDPAYTSTSPTRPGAPREEPRIAINRLRRASVLAVVQRYSPLFTKDVPDEETRELLRHQDQREQIRNTLEAAWERYSASADGQTCAVIFSGLLPRLCSWQTNRQWRSPQRRADSRALLRK